MKPLSVRIMQWADVPDQWREALGPDAAGRQVLFVPEGRNLSVPHRPAAQAEVDGGTVYAYEKV